MKLNSPQTWTPQSEAQRTLLSYLDRASANVPSTESVDWAVPNREPPKCWQLTGGRELHGWQREARNRWFEAGRRGTVKVVTGAGKTNLALSVAERLQMEEPELRMVVVVPTVVLLDQWYRTLLEDSNLPSRWIGRLGGGSKDDLSGERRVLLCVLATARRRLPEIVLSSGHASRTLMVVDECHRIGALESARVMDTPAAFRLGLSATPERSDTSDDSNTRGFSYDETSVGKWLGAIIYELNYSEAIEQEILPPFELLHYGLPLAPTERQKYNELSRSINELRDRLKQLSPLARSLSGERLAAWCRRISVKSGDLARVAAAFVGHTSERKRLLYSADSRSQATLALLARLAHDTPPSRAILFHESIEEVERLYEALAAHGIAAVMEHSNLPSAIRRRSIECFRSGAADVIVSVRSLIEGFNVPSADVGVIVASSSSPRQRIQSIGRVLRRYGDRRITQKLARVCVFYVRDTVDEIIYEKIDWSGLTGLERNFYFSWDPPEEPIRLPGPPRERIPQDSEIDSVLLCEGATYPGRYEGTEYSTDTAGNVRDTGGLTATNPQGVPARLLAIRGEAGKFKVSPRCHHLLVLRRAEAGWETFFAGVLKEAFHFADVSTAEAPTDSIPGEPYSGPRQASLTLRFSQKANGTIVKRVKGGELLARGPHAEALVKRLRELESKFGRITRFEINSVGHAYWTADGITRFISAEADKLNFPQEHGSGVDS